MPSQSPYHKGAEHVISSRHNGFPAHESTTASYKSDRPNYQQDVDDPEDLAKLHSPGKELLDPVIGSWESGPNDCSEADVDNGANNADGVNNHGKVENGVGINNHHRTKDHGATNGQIEAIEDIHVKGKGVEVEQYILPTYLQRGGHCTLRSEARHSDLFPGESGTSVSNARRDHTAVLFARTVDLVLTINGSNADGGTVAEARELAAFYEHGPLPHPIGLAGGYDPQVEMTHNIQRYRAGERSST